MKLVSKLLALVLALCALPAAAQERMTGPVFTEFGAWYAVESGLPLDTTIEYKVIFDALPSAEPGNLNGRIDSAARWINIMVAHGVPQENLSLAVIVHGPAIWDVTNDAAYGHRNGGAANASTEAIAAMIAQGVKFYVCGQSATSQGISAADLLPGVVMTLGQTIATAQLHAQGYTNIP